MIEKDYTPVTWNAVLAFLADNPDQRFTNKEIAETNHFDPLETMRITKMMRAAGEIDAYKDREVFAAGRPVFYSHKN